MRPDGSPSGAREQSAERTRAALLDAATRIFAEHGYEAGSVGLITQAAGANRAAVTYHFGGKEELYRAVLDDSTSIFEDGRGFAPDELDRLAPPDALRRFFRQYLSPLSRRDRTGDVLRIVARETALPSPVFARFMSETTFPALVAAERLARRFRPADGPEEAAILSLWLFNQPFAFVRDAALLSRPPFSLRFDAAFIERLVDRLTRLSLAGLHG